MSKKEQEVLTKLRKSLTAFQELAGNSMTGENVFFVNESELRAVQNLTDLVVELGAD